MGAGGQGGKEGARQHETTQAHTCTHLAWGCTVTWTGGWLPQGHLALTGTGPRLYGMAMGVGWRGGARCGGQATWVEGGGGGKGRTAVQKAASRALWASKQPAAVASQPSRPLAPLPAPSRMCGTTGSVRSPSARSPPLTNHGFDQRVGRAWIWLTARSKPTKAARRHQVLWVMAGWLQVLVTDVVNNCWGEGLGLTVPAAGVNALARCGPRLGGATNEDATL